MTILQDTETGKYYRFAGYRVPKPGESYLNATGRVVIVNHSWTPTGNERVILREVLPSTTYPDRPGQERSYTE